MSHETCSGTECPECHRHTVISINATLWQCLNCDFTKDFSEEEEDEEESDNTGILAVIGGFVITAVCLLSL